MKRLQAQKAFDELHARYDQVKTEFTALKTESATLKAERDEALELAGKLRESKRLNTVNANAAIQQYQTKSVLKKQVRYQLITAGPWYWKKRSNKVRKKSAQLNKIPQIGSSVYMKLPRQPNGKALH